ncbi:MAG: primase, partial [Verrucomicrobiota bacterium]
DKRIAKDWQIGFAPESWDAFLNWALERGYQQRLLLESGLVARREEGGSDNKGYDRFRNRIMFPIHNDVGEVIAFSGRVLDQQAETAKYVNSPETPLFRKGRVLFGLHKTKRALIEAHSAIICEGQLDLITLFEAGVKNVVAPQGTAFTEHQARVLKRFVEEIVLCFDSDSAGYKAAERSLGALLKSDSAWFNAFAFHLRIRLAEMPPGEDPDSLIRGKGVSAFVDLVAKAPDFFDYWLSRAAAQTDLASVNERVELARALAGTVSHIHDPLMRSQVAQKVATRLEIPITEFDRLLIKPTATTALAPSAPLVSIRHDIAMLCVLALRHDDARQFLLSQDWRAMLAHTPDCEILIRVLESDLRPDDPASLNAFMAGLSPGEEALVSGWLLQKMPPNGLAVAEGFWNGLRQAALRRQLQIAEGRMKLPRLTTGEAVALQKQILDLTEQLRHLSAFSSARVLDS